MQALAEGMLQRGHQVTVVTTQPEGEGSVAQINGVQVCYLPVENIYRPFSEERPNVARKALWHAIDSYNPGMRRALGAILDREKPDIVNSHNIVGFSAAAFTAVKERKLPLVHTLHDQYLLCPKSTMFRRGRNCQSPCLSCGVLAIPRRRQSLRVDVVIGVSRFILDRHLGFGYFADAEPRVIYNGIETAAAVSRSPRTNGAFRFGFLGQIRPTKGLHELIEAFVAECGGEAELWIAGHGDVSYERELRERTATVPGVRWLGFVDPRNLLDAVDVLVVPSVWRDTAPLVVLEALASAVPVLGSDRGGIPELIPPDAGWVYDPDEKGALRRALRVCLQSRTRLDQMGERGRLQVAAFGRSQFLDRYLSAYQSALERT